MSNEKVYLQYKDSNENKQMHYKDTNLSKHKSDNYPLTDRNLK